MKYSSPLLIASLHFLASLFIIFTISNQGPTTPYMDEIFHIPQTIRFVKDGVNASYDPKITTPPGLYIPSAAALRFVRNNVRVAKSDWFGTPEFETVFLRSSNALYSAMIVFFASKEGVSSFGALCIATLPVLYFSSCLFYSDTLSTLLVLLIMKYSSSPPGGGVGVINKIFGGLRLFLISVFALSVRQTNVLWIAFGLCTMVIESTAPIVRYIGGESDTLKGSQPNRLILFGVFVGHVIVKAVTTSFTFIAYVLPCILFVVFIVWNNGQIVLGDASNHIPGLHLAQLPLACVFVVVFFPFHSLRCLRSTILTRPTKFEIEVFVVMTVCFGFCLRDVHAHPFLLSDNRHYTFYLYRRVLQNVKVRYVFCLPLSVLGFGTVFGSHGFATQKTRLWKFALLIVTACNVVPQKLIEVRYFVPFLVVAAMQGVQQRDGQRLWSLTLVWHVVLNLVTLYIFVYHPVMYNAQEKGRLMW